MKKDFDQWNEDKKKIHFINPNRFCRERQIWWCAFGLNIGFEQDGTGESYERPALILRALSAETCLVLPLTTSDHIHPMRIPIGIVNEQPASVILSQIRVIDTKRLLNKIGYVDKTVFEVIKTATRNLI